MRNLSEALDGYDENKIQEIKALGLNAAKEEEKVRLQIERAEKAEKRLVSSKGSRPF